MVLSRFRGIARFDRALQAMEQRPGRTFAVIGLVFALGYAGALSAAPRNRLVEGDGIQYYAYLRSLVFDHDLDFSNDYARLYGTDSGSVWLHTRTAAGRPPNMMSIGPALLWSPIYLLAIGLVGAARLAGLGVPLDGFGWPLPVAAGVAGVIYASAGGYVSYRTAALHFSPRAAFWGALLAWLASPAVYYSLVSPTYSHATSLFTVAVFVFVWLRSRGRLSVGRFAGLGILAGVAALVRWQEITVLLLPAAELIAAVRQRPSGFGPAVRAALVLVLAAGVAFTPQLLAWHAIFGSYVLTPQGETFMHWTTPAVLSVLFSPNHGLFTWTPAVLVAVVGLVWLVGRDRLVGVAAIALLVMAVYINASVADWWAGEAFGARRFVSDTVVFALGFAAFGSAIGQRVNAVWLRLAALAIIGYNLLFLLQYQLFMRGFVGLAPYPATWRQILLDRLWLPFALLRAWTGA